MSDYNPNKRTAEILDRAYELIQSVPYKVSGRRYSFVFLGRFAKMTSDTKTKIKYWGPVKGVFDADQHRVVVTIKRDPEDTRLPDATIAKVVDWCTSDLSGYQEGGWEVDVSDLLPYSESDLGTNLEEVKERESV
jgi:hypothetical protein